MALFSEEKLDTPEVHADRGDRIRDDFCIKTQTMRDLAQIVLMTQDLFGGSVQIEAESDPEFPEDIYLSLIVELNDCNPITVTDKRCEWHKRVDEIAGRAYNDLRLSLRFVE